MNVLVLQKWILEGAAVRVKYGSLFHNTGGFV